MSPGDPEPAGIYLHVPFCSRVCPYCDFAVQVAKRERRREFTGLLAAEIDRRRGFPFPEGVDTVYLGGGTPSILEPEDLETLFAALRRAFPLRPGTLFYLEANPEDVTAENLEAWRELGVTNLSLGVQSFDAAELESLGRRHGPREGREAVERALEAGFETVSLDLIFGLPGQSRAIFQRNLETAVAFGPEHLSLYQLTFHEGTAFGRWLERGELAEMPESEQAELFLLAHEVLGAAGYTAYEVSNWARAPGFRSRHNQKYWHHVPYLGLGPAAHSFDGRRRSWNVRTLKDYRTRIEAGESPVAESEVLGAEELALEAVMLGLRTADGLDLAALRERFGVDLAALDAAHFERLEAEGLCRWDREAETLRPTPRGLAVADGLAVGLRLR